MCELSAAIVRTTPDKVLSAHVQCADHCAVTEIHRRARECTIETTIQAYIHINIYIGFPFNTIWLLAHFARSPNQFYSLLLIVLIAEMENNSKSTV